MGTIRAPGVPREEIQVLERISLRGVGPAPELDLELAPRLNLLTGDNGLGKTFVLDVAWWAMTHSWAGDQAWPEPNAAKPRIHCRLDGSETSSWFKFRTQSWSLPREPNPHSSLVLYARVDGSFSAYDPAREVASEYVAAMPSPEDLAKTFHFSP